MHEDEGVKNENKKTHMLYISSFFFPEIFCRKLTLSVYFDFPRTFFAVRLRMRFFIFWYLCLFILLIRFLFVESNLIAPICCCNPRWEEKIEDVDEEEEESMKREDGTPAVKEGAALPTHKLGAERIAEIGLSDTAIGWWERVKKGRSTWWGTWIDDFDWIKNYF